MKCDELEKFDATSNAERSAGIESRYAYDADEVDEAIEEFKEVYKESVDVKVKIWERCKKAEDELRKNQRALWMARAERAASWQIHFSLCHNHSIEREFFINGTSMPCEGMATMRTAKDWAMIWKKVERLCLKKAEEYK